ncbi:hypothetical protein BGZ95_000194 [Linnemannia exigua]|uniref:Uncharacterized protein n=1 Tax=Linnemannia exigua TaxID=604196 RepID=A0AAD4H4Y4_9FUNG|nr:hypothetical protein BGZ95_000194 [Linnemannia exigua]
MKSLFSTLFTSAIIAAFVLVSILSIANAAPIPHHLKPGNHNNGTVTANSTSTHTAESANTESTSSEATSTPL